MLAAALILGELGSSVQHPVQCHLTEISREIYPASAARERLPEKASETSGLRGGPQSEDQRSAKALREGTGWFLKASHRAHIERTQRPDLGLPQRQ